MKNIFLTIVLLLLTCPSMLIAQDLINGKLVYSEAGMENIEAKVQEYMVWEDSLSLNAHYYLPESKSSKSLPAVVFINIGGLEVPQWGLYKDWARLVANNGMVGILYQTLRGNSVDQTQALLDHIVENSESLNIDKNRISIWASSANATVGLPIIWDTNNQMIKSAVFYYGIMNGGKPTRNDIPFYIVKSGQDALFINKTIDSFLEEAINNDLKFTFVNYVEGKHVFDSYDDTEESYEIIKETVSFLEKTLITNADETYDPSPTPSRVLYQTREDGVDEVIGNLKQYHDSNPDAFIFQENTLVQVGNEIISDSIASSIDWYKFVKELYPGSSRSAYNIGYGYENTGNTKMALKYYEESLKLVKNDNSLFSSVREFILREAPKKIDKLKND